MMIDKHWPIKLLLQIATLLRDKSVTFFNSHETRVTVNLHNSEILTCLRKQPSFLDETTGFPAKWHLRIERRIPYWWCITTQIYFLFGTANQKHYPDLVLTPHQYGMFVLVSRMSFHRVTSDGITKCQLFSQANLHLAFLVQNYNWQSICHFSKESTEK